MAIKEQDGTRLKLSAAFGGELIPDECDQDERRGPKKTQNCRQSHDFNWTGRSKTVKERTLRKDLNGATAEASLRQTADFPSWRGKRPPSPRPTLPARLPQVAAGSGDRTRSSSRARAASASNRS